MPTAKLNGIDIYYEEHGASPAIIMTHGLGDSAEHAMRTGLVQELVPANQTLERALVVVEAMGCNPQRAMRRDRQAVLEGLTRPSDDGLTHEAQVHHDTAADPEMADWLRRYTAGERPQPFRRFS